MSRTDNNFLKAQTELTQITLSEALKLVDTVARLVEIKSSAVLDVFISRP